MGIERLGRIVTVLLVVLAASAVEVEAQQLVFRPTNPAFGGNPLNQQWLLSTAEAQKPLQAQEGGSMERDALADFQSNLQRQILSSLAREIVESRFGPDLDLSQPGTFDLGDFIIEIIPGAGGVDISILNLLTGGSTTITIPGS